MAGESAFSLLPRDLALHRRTFPPPRHPRIPSPQNLHHPRHPRQPNHRSTPPNLPPQRHASIRAAKLRPIRKQKTHLPHQFSAGQSQQRPNPRILQWRQRKPALFQRRSQPPRNPRTKPTLRIKKQPPPSMPPLPIRPLTNQRNHRLASFPSRCPAPSFRTEQPDAFLPAQLPVGRSDCAERNPSSLSSTRHSFTLSFEGPLLPIPLPNTVISNGAARRFSSRPTACWAVGLRREKSLFSFFHSPLPHPAFFLSLPNNVTTFPRNLPIPFNAGVGIRITSSNNPLITVKNSSMDSNRSRVYASPAGFPFNSATHSPITRSVGSISRRFRSSLTIRKISQTSLIDSKCSRRSPSTCTIRTIPHPCNSRKLVLTFDRATASVVEISSAGIGFGDKKSNACTCATVRLIPHRVPISPQCKINFCATTLSPAWPAFTASLPLISLISSRPPVVDRLARTLTLSIGCPVMLFMSVISVISEYTIHTAPCQDSHCPAHRPGVPSASPPAPP